MRRQSRRRGDRPTGRRTRAESAAVRGPWLIVVPAGREGVDAHWPSRKGTRGGRVDAQPGGQTGVVTASSLTPPDAIVALRSLPRRFRSMVMPTPEDMPTPDAVRTSLEAAGVAAGRLEAIGAQLRRVLLNDTPDLAPLPATDGGDPSTALDRLAAAATAVADLADSQA